MASIDFGGVDMLSFDCNGTLIDWETGILNALREVVGADATTDEQLLTDYAGYTPKRQRVRWRI